MGRVEEGHRKQGQEQPGVELAWGLGGYSGTCDLIR